MTVLGDAMSSIGGVLAPSTVVLASLSLDAAGGTLGMRWAFGC